MGFNGCLFRGSLVPTVWMIQEFAFAKEATFMCGVCVIETSKIDSIGYE
jgi:hypothetical protein